VNIPLDYDEDIHDVHMQFYLAYFVVLCYVRAFSQLGILVDLDHGCQEQEQEGKDQHDKVVVYGTRKRKKVLEEERSIWYHERLFRNAEKK